MTSAVVGGKTLTRRTEGGQVIYDGFIDTGGGGGGGGMTGQYILDIPNYQNFTYKKATNYYSGGWTVSTTATTGPVDIMSIMQSNGYGSDGMVVEHNLNSRFLDIKFWLNDALIANGHTGEGSASPATPYNGEGVQVTHLDSNKLILCIVGTGSEAVFFVPSNGRLGIKMNGTSHGGANPTPITSAKLIINSYT